ncbi:hypothetical protein [Pseudomonas phage LUZ7]|uniref:Uncharacterized protein n=1 Tax=Pseudomonas phage LUZ7 TaxID=655097 RepID=C8ZKK6_9CAUD|nr:hypothetical protein PP-LUZ7_gp107 [Pseudomonas phage LUZ7]CAZ66248.1 hypothetical protein [Pseudomonas phage LUZ7]
MSDIESAYQIVFLYLLGDKYKKEALTAEGTARQDKAWDMQWTLRTHSTTNIGWVKVWATVETSV